MKTKPDLARVPTVIFAYNRPDLLTNAVASWERFDSVGTLTIFDDRSEDDRQRELLRGLRDRGVEVLVGDPQEHRGMRGGLYDNMRRMLELARKRRWEAVHFMQDDMQFVAPAGYGYAQAMRIARGHPAAAMVGLSFHKILYRRQPILEDESGYVHCSLHFAATGVAFPDRMPPSAIGSTERETSNNAKALGLCRCMIRDPVLTQIPFVPMLRQGRIVGRSRGTAAPLLLHPVDTELLVARPIAERPFDERFIRPWGWNCRKPYVPRYIGVGKWVLKCLKRVYRFRDIRCFPRYTLGVRHTA